MNKQPVISQEYFEELLGDAIGDLQNSGLSPDQIFLIIKDLFGLDYAHKFCFEIKDRPFQHQPHPWKNPSIPKGD